MSDCPNCRGLREVIRNQQEFILSIKKAIADYSGEYKHWRNRRDKPS